MKNLELNKILGAVLFVAFIIAFSSNFIDIVYSSLNGVSLHGNDHQVEMADELSESGDNNGSSGQSITQEKVFDIPALLAKANADNGKKITAKCTSCHTFEKGQPNKVGPNLYGISGASIAHTEGFNYSNALKSHGGKWDCKSLVAWFHAPKKFIPGNRMAYGGISSEQDIADLLAYFLKNGDIEQKCE